MAFIRNGIQVGDRVRLTQDVSVIAGTYTKGHEFKVVGSHTMGYDLQDADGNTLGDVGRINPGCLERIG